MKAKIVFVMFFVVSLFLAGNSQAVMHRVVANVWTQSNYNQAGVVEQRLVVKVDVFDDLMKHPPDFVSTIEITAPDTTVFTLKSDDFSLQKSWNAWDHAFIQGYIAGDFTGGVIPGGTYKVKVTPVSGTAITETDSVVAKFLTPPVVVYPTSSLTGVPQTPTLKWGAVASATHYRINLFINGGDPVYFRMHNVKETDFTSYKIPPGVLKPNTQYRVQIEARSGGQDLDMRSQSVWVNFTTGSW